MAKWISAKQFIDQTKGKTYDMDGWYGPTCWDYGDYFWYTQVGRSLSTGGTGSAFGCWTVESARKANAGKEFQLITDKSKLKYGDWIILGPGKDVGDDGHVGTVTAVNLGKNTVQVQSQNQGLFRAKVTKETFKLDSFLGAFRYKNFWSNKPKEGDKVKTTAYRDVYGKLINRKVVNDGQSVWKKTDNHGKHAWLYKGRTLRAIVKVNTLTKA